MDKFIFHAYRLGAYVAVVRDSWAGFDFLSFRRNVTGIANATIIVAITNTSSTLQVKANCCSASFGLITPAK